MGNVRIELHKSFPVYLFTYHHIYVGRYPRTLASQFTRHNARAKRAPTPLGFFLTKPYNSTRAIYSGSQSFPENLSKARESEREEKNGKDSFPAEELEKEEEEERFYTEPTVSFVTRLLAFFAVRQAFLDILLLLPRYKLVNLAKKAFSWNITTTDTGTSPGFFTKELRRCF